VQVSCHRRRRRVGGVARGLLAPPLGLKTAGTMRYDVRAMLRAIEAAVATYPPAAMFALRDEGFASVFEQAVACVISVRTRDETTVVVARRLFATAPHARDVLELEPTRLDALLRGTTFRPAKLASIRAIAKAAAARPGGELPADDAFLRSLPGIGPKCAALVLGVAANIPGVSVDVHVQRIVHRWGIVTTTKPPETARALERLVPRDLWIDVNRLLVPFGKHVCTALAPHCPTCPVRASCLRVGVRTVAPERPRVGARAVREPRANPSA
jgi:endonuclease-3